MDCPKCLGKLSPVTVRISEAESRSRGEGAVDRIEVDQCFVCTGVWFDRGELEKYLSRRLTIIDSPEIETEMRKEQDRKIGKCPRCRIDMVKKKSPRDSSVTIDVCEQCSGIWLDNTEIDKLEKTGMGIKNKILSAIRKIF